MTLTGCSDTSLSSKTKFTSALAGQIRRRLPAVEAGTIIVWALTPLVVAAVVAVS